MPKALREFAEARGVVWERSIVVRLEVDFPGMGRLFGLLLTQDEKFVHFEIDTDQEHNVITEVEEWSDVTAEQNLSLHNRGIGIGMGALAVKVLHELNA